MLRVHVWCGEAAIVDPTDKKHQECTLLERNDRNKDTGIPTVARRAPWIDPNVKKYQSSRLVLALALTRDEIDATQGK